MTKNQSLPESVIFPALLLPQLLGHLVMVIQYGHWAWYKYHNTEMKNNRSLLENRYIPCVNSSSLKCWDTWLWSYSNDTGHDTNIMIQWHITKNQSLPESVIFPVLLLPQLLRHLVMVIQYGQWAWYKYHYTEMKNNRSLPENRYIPCVAPPSIAGTLGHSHTVWTLGVIQISWYRDEKQPVLTRKSLYALRCSSLNCWGTWLWSYSMDTGRDTNITIQRWKTTGPYQKIVIFPAPLLPQLLWNLVVVIYLLIVFRRREVSWCATLSEFLSSSVSLLVFLLNVGTKNITCYIQFG